MNWFRYLWTILRDYDSNEYLVCADCDWRMVWQSIDLRVCPDCGGQVQVQLPRGEALGLLLMDLQHLFPYRAYEYGEGEFPDGNCVLLWLWRDHVLWPRSYGRDAA